MFSQFQARYPMGSLVSELLQIHDGNYVVRAVVQVGGVTLATGMAAAAEIDQAEDQARIRALAVLGIYLPANESMGRFETFPSEAYRIVDPEGEAKPTPASLSPKTPDLILAHQPEVDWPVEQVTPLSGFSSSPLSSPNPPTESLPDTLKRNNQNGKVATQPGKAAPKNGTRPKPVDLSDIIAQTSVELRRLNWSDAQGRSYLQHTYGKRSRQQLTDEELLEFLHYLQSQPSADEPSF